MIETNNEQRCWCDALGLELKNSAVGAKHDGSSSLDLQLLVQAVSHLIFK
jgi:hypothetical protein